MPELKNTFTGGRMEKDLDERIVPNGLYREALNIEVSTSEGSDVGAAQNILGNIQVTEALQGPLPLMQITTHGETKYQGANRHIAHIVDPETDMLYRFVSTESPTHGVWVDRIVEYDTTKKLSDAWDVKEKAVMVDVWKVRTKCEGLSEACGVTTLTVRTNFAQIRPYMVLLYDGEMREDCRIMAVEWGIDGTGPYAEIQLSLDVTGEEWYKDDWCPSGLPTWQGADIYFAMDRILNFHPERKITGINVLDGMLFWTDNYSEPKKVNIERGKLGSHYELKPMGTPTALNYIYEDFDKHTKLVINVDEITGVGEIPEECVMLDEECPIPGCTDTTAVNWSSTANADCSGVVGGTDYSCCTPCDYGCTNPAAYNYSPAATCDDGSCCLTTGCTTEGDCNYSPAACHHNPSLCHGLPMCTDPLAKNHGKDCFGNTVYDTGTNCNNNCCDYQWKCHQIGWQNSACSGEDKFAGVVGLTTMPTSGQPWTGDFYEVINNLVDSGKSHELMSTGCWSGTPGQGVCTGVWYQQGFPGRNNLSYHTVGHTGDYDNSGTGYGSNGLPDYLYFAEQEIAGTTSYKCIEPSGPTTQSPSATGNPNAMTQTVWTDANNTVYGTVQPLTHTAGDYWLVSKNIRGINITMMLPEDPICAGNDNCTGTSAEVPKILENYFTMGDHPQPPTTNTALGTGPHGIGFTTDSSNWSWSRNTQGYPDVITVLQWNGFDGTNPWGATLNADITLPNAGTTYYSGAPMPLIDENWNVEDVFAIVADAASWSITPGSYLREWEQWDYANNQAGGSSMTYTNEWEVTSSWIQFTIEIEEGFCECDGGWVCDCVQDPAGDGYETKLECETASSNCCSVTTGSGGGAASRLSAPLPWFGEPYTPPPLPEVVSEEQTEQELDETGDYE